jgi:hypothetical protein
MEDDTPNIHAVCLEPMLNTLRRYQRGLVTTVEAVELAAADGFRVAQAADHDKPEHMVSSIDEVRQWVVNHGIDHEEVIDELPLAVVAGIQRGKGGMDQRLSEESQRALRGWWGVQVEAYIGSAAPGRRERLLARAIQLGGVTPLCSAQFLVDMLAQAASEQNPFGYPHVLALTLVEYACGPLGTVHRIAVKPVPDSVYHRLTIEVEVPRP